MFEQTFKNIDDILWKEAGCQSELDYVEQTSWIIFLKYLDDLERERETKAELIGKNYESIIADKYRWEVWAAPKLSFPHGGGQRSGTKFGEGMQIAFMGSSKMEPTFKDFLIVQY